MKCLIDGCNASGKIRGLCPICYQAAVASIKKTCITWGYLEDAGLADKPQHKPSGHGAFTKALRKLNDNKALHKLNREEGDL